MVTFCDIFFNNLYMLHISFVAGAVGADAASCYGSGSTNMMRLRVQLHSTGLHILYRYCKVKGLKYSYHKIKSGFLSSIQ
jgi:hypothetical protein